MSVSDAIARRVAIAHAVAQAVDQAHLNSTGNVVDRDLALIDAISEVHSSITSHGEPDHAALLRLAGMSIAWLEHLAALDAST